MVRHLRALVIGGIALAVGTAGGCSLVVDGNAAQCETTDECKSRGATFAATVCGPQKTCVDGAASGQCTSNADCVATLGAASICSPKTKRCTKLITPECPQLLGSVAQEGTVVIGAMFSDIGTPTGAGFARLRAVELAVADFNSEQRGVPSAGAAPRPFAVLACDDIDTKDEMGNPNGEARKRAAKHLTTEVEVPAIIGGQTSSTTLDIFTNYAAPNRVLLMAPTASADSITSSDRIGKVDPPLPARLLWRLAPTDTLQSIALRDQLPALEGAFRTTYATPTATTLKLAVIVRDDAYGAGLLREFNAAQLNGKDIGPSPAMGVSFQTYVVPIKDEIAAPIVKKVVTQAPSIVVVLGNAEVPDSFLKPIEMTWGTEPRPYYLFSDGARRDALLTAVNLGTPAAVDGLRKRIRVTGAGTPTPSGPYTEFAGRLETKYGIKPGVGVAEAFDAFYMIALALVGANEKQPNGGKYFTGDDVSLGLAKLLDNSGPPVEELAITRGNLGKLWPAISGGKTIRIRGASGRLSLDPLTGEGPADINVWCIARDGAGIKWQPSLRYLDSNKSPPAMSGIFNPGLCNY
jgi:ABC-type branched-subunit amino acid transport system substrate-binding protein